MRNVKVQIEGDFLFISVRLTAPREPSASGKTQVIASTQGNHSIDTPDGKTIYVGLNVYEYPQKG